MNMHMGKSQGMKKDTSLGIRVTLETRTQNKPRWPVFTHGSRTRLNHHDNQVELHHTQT